MSRYPQYNFFEEGKDPCPYCGKGSKTKIVAKGAVWYIDEYLDDGCVLYKCDNCKHIFEIKVV